MGDLHGNSTSSYLRTHESNGRHVAYLSENSWGNHVDRRVGRLVCGDKAMGSPAVPGNFARACARARFEPQLPVKFLKLAETQICFAVRFLVVL